ADSDYTAASGTVTFNPGQTSKTITVNVNGDSKFESDETFTVGLSSPSNATISGTQGTATGTIDNDDTQPVISAANLSQSEVISVTDPVQPEGNSGTTAFLFTVNLSNPSAQTITVNFSTANGSATVIDGDYQSNSGTLTFAPGEASKTVTVLVNGDTKFESDE